MNLNTALVGTNAVFFYMESFMRPNCERFVTHGERSFILFGDSTATRRFGFSVFPDGSFGLAILAVFASDSASDFTAYQLDDESCEPDFIEVLGRRDAQCIVTEAMYVLPAGLAKYGAFKFGTGKTIKTLVRVLKPIAYLED